MLELMPPFYFLTFAKVSVSVSKKFGLKKVSVSISKTFGLKKSLGIGLENIWSRKKVSVSVSKTFGLKKKSLSIGLKNIWSRKKSRSRSRKFWSQKKVSVSVSMKFFGLVTQWFYITYHISYVTYHMLFIHNGQSNMRLWGGLALRYIRQSGIKLALQSNWLYALWISHRVHQWEVNLRFLHIVFSVQSKVD